MFNPVAVSGVIVLWFLCFYVPVNFVYVLSSQAAFVFLQVFDFVCRLHFLNSIYINYLYSNFNSLYTSKNFHTSSRSTVNACYYRDAGNLVKMYTILYKRNSSNPFKNKLLG